MSDRLLRFSDHIVDLKIPLEIAAGSFAEADRICADWFDGLKRGLTPGFLFGHTVQFDPPTIKGRCLLALRIHADCAAAAISRIPEFHERFGAPGLISIGDWRGGVSVRPTMPSLPPIRIA